MRPARPYQAPWWLPGGHVQTLYTALFAPVPHVDYRRERLNLPDGDFVDLDWVDGAMDAPLILLVHGLEGHSRGHYALSLMHAAQARGWRGVVAHFRGCSGEPNRLHALISRVTRAISTSWYNTFAATLVRVGSIPPVSRSVATPCSNG